jgi:predicted ATPase/class 3 adenylate cyclase
MEVTGGLLATQTLTFLFTDIEGSTAMLRRLGSVYAELLSDHHRLIRAQLSAHGGREIDTQGDAFFAVFSSPSSCVTAAIEMQRALASRSWPGGEGLRVRMGIHSGEVSETAVGPVGLDVHRGARIAAAGHGGQVLVSATTAALLRDSMPAGAFLSDLGLHQLKDFGQAEQLFQLEADGLQVAFPPLRSRQDPTVLTSLPAQLSSCIGRDVELVELEGLITGSRLVTLTGPGGVGKTRLAIEVAERVAGEFADGVVFVDLAPLRDPGLVLGAIARRLGVDERDATPLPDLLAVSLRGKRLLVLLDNFEHLLPARDPVLALLQACPELVILVTSRVALDVRGGRDYPVAPLVLPGEAGPPEALRNSPAVELLVERARAVGTELPLDAETAPAVAEICRRLDGLPLAIELAAARVRLLPPAALLARLDRRLPVLAGGPHDLPARQQTMRDAIAWSYELLDEPEQALFRRLCVFVGGCTLEAAEVICADGREDPPVLDLMASLVASSLLRPPVTPAAGNDDAPPATPRLTMLETIREYGTELLAARSETEETGRRHAAYYLALAEQAGPAITGPDAVAWLARLDAEHDNLRAALRWAREQDGAAALRLAAALWPFWERRGHLSEGRRWLAEALDRPAATVAPSVRVNGLIGAARLAIDQAAYDEATERCAQAVATASELGDPRLLAATLNTQGLLARAQDRYADSARDHQAALEQARAGADRAGEAAALLGLAYAAMFTGDGPRASILAEESLAAARDAGDRHTLAQVLSLLGWEAGSAGPDASERAEAFGTEALGLFRTLGDTGWQADMLFMLGTFAANTGDYQRAARLFADSVTLQRKRGDENGTTRGLAGLGTALLNLGDRTAAREMIEDSLAVARKFDNRWSTAMSLTVLGQVELADGDHTRAQTLLTEAASLFADTGNLIYPQWCLEGLAGAAAARGDYERAAELDGARDALRAQLGVLLSPVHPAAYARTLATVRARLSPAALDAARAKPSGQTPQQIITAATSNSNSPPPKSAR